MFKASFGDQLSRHWQLIVTTLFTPKWPPGHLLYMGNKFSKMFKIILINFLHCFSRRRKSEQKKMIHQNENNGLYRKIVTLGKALAMAIYPIIADFSVNFFKARFR